MDLKFQIKYFGKYNGFETYFFHDIKITVEKGRKTRNKQEWTYTIKIHKNGLFFYEFKQTTNSKIMGNKSLAQAIEQNEQAKKTIIHLLFRKY